MTDLQKLLSMIKCTKTYIRKSSVCSGDEFRITLTYKSKKAVFSFHDNYFNESDKSDFIRCLLIDCLAFDYTSDVYDFMREYGYNDMQVARFTYKMCEKQSKRVHRLFNDQELDILTEIID